MKREYSAFLNRYFWGANVAVWCALHIIFTQVQWGASLGSEKESSWAHLWLLLLPWFANWTWMTACVFIVAVKNNDPGRSITAKVMTHVVSAIILLSVYWATCVFFQMLIKGEPLSTYFENVQRIVAISAEIDIALYISVLSIALGLLFYHGIVEDRIELKRLNHALTGEQLKTLRSQLNPHFLFNALNTIASLVRLKREKDAVHALSELSLMLRTILENKSHDDVKLKDEIAFIKSYLSIQQMRFTNKLDAHISVAEDCLNLDIPNMLLQPLVENAVQHGSQLESNKNLLNLEITRSATELKVKLTNKVAVDDSHAGFGIGLTNTRARLSRLYKHFQLELTPLSDDLFETLLAIPIGEQDA